MVYLKAILKGVLEWICLAAAFPFALSSGLGRIEALYTLWAQSFASIPGLPGDYLRTAYYRMTLKECPARVRIQFGSFFAHPQVKLGHGVYIGSYCILGKTTIGNRTHLASAVQVLSGAHQHGRAEDGRILGAEEGVFENVNIGADCWIGAGSIIMADVGKGTTISAGSVVTRPIPEGSIAAGNPARVLQAAAQSS
jgi:acetyltransferase-like isoleucine patch superfamily enzyme